MGYYNRNGGVIGLDYDTSSKGVFDTINHKLNSQVVTENAVVRYDASVRSSVVNNWKDLTGNNLNANRFGPTWYDGNGGRWDFDGTNDKFEINHTAALNFTTGITLSAWFKFDSLPSSEMPFFRKSPNWQLGMINSSSIRCLCATDGNTGWRTGIDVSYTFSTGTWYNMVMTYSDGYDMKVYVNNTLEQTNAVDGTMTTGTGNAVIGYSYSSGVYLDGSIGHMSIYSARLTTEQLTQNWNALKGRYGY